jgi:hypothetical protein
VTATPKELTMPSRALWGLPIRRLPLWVATLTAAMAIRPARGDAFGGDVAVRVKAATAVVVIDASSTASGFCVHPAGLFVTHRSVVDAAHATVGSELTVFVDPDRRQMTAAVLRVNGQVALLWANDGRAVPFTALTLAGPGEMAGRRDLWAVGYPAMATATHGADPPGFEAHFETCRYPDRPTDHLLGIYIPDAVDDGLCGGPLVLDRLGRVFGVIGQTMGTGHARPRFATLIAPVIELGRDPLVAVRVTPAGGRAQTFTAAMFATVDKPTAAHATITIGTGPSAVTGPMTEVAPGTFTATAVPPPAADAAHPAVPYTVAVQDGATSLGEAQGEVAGGPPVVAAVAPPPPLTLKPAVPAPASPPVAMVAGPPPAPLPPPGPLVIQLPGTITGTAVGGGGRYLILHLGKLRQLALFDVRQAKVTAFISLPSDDITFTAGATQLYVGLRDLKLIEAYDLAKGTLVHNYAAPPCGVGTLAMGAESAGPLVLLGDEHSKGFLWLNPQTLQSAPYPSKHWGREGSAWGPVHVHVSFDGSTVVACGGGWAGIEVTDLIGCRVAGLQTGGYATGDAIPVGNGSLIFGDGPDPVRPDLTSKVTGFTGHLFPADDAAFSCSLVDAKGNGARPGGKGLAVFNNADPRPLLTLVGLPELAEESKLPLRERVHLIPREHALAIVGRGGDKLVLRPFDLARELAVTGHDYLYVDSAPPSFAVRGQGFVYAMHVESSRGGVTIELQSAPAGMRASKAGLIRWGVPTAYPQETASVIAKVTDAAGDTVFHTFAVVLGTPPELPHLAGPVAGDPVPTLPIVRPGIHLGFQN